MIIKDSLSTNLLNIDSITYHAILPSAYNRVLYWLHGYKETSETILAKSDLVFYAEKYFSMAFLKKLWILFSK